jgi:predicted helicase
MTIEQYLQSINTRFKLGNSTEHTFRGDLQQLIEALSPGFRATNEPKRQKCGAPDYIITKKDIPVGFIEAKDIGAVDLEGIKKLGNKEQFDRYRTSLDNIIFTDYLDFLLYRNGQLVLRVAIGEITEKEIKPIPANFNAFTDLIKDFCQYKGQTIKSSKKLAEMMAAKAKLLSAVIEKALTSDEKHSEDSTLKDQMIAFKEILIHDITPKGFADVYAQTIAYGMFAARLHDPCLENFSRQEASELIPKSNPFLRRLFGYIAGPDLDDRIKWIVDSLVEIFLACNVEELLKDYGKDTKTEDPIIHFYETFLSEYDPALRKARGVWYTPKPVVNFIVRAVDDILKTEFGLPQGLADTSKTTIKIQDVSKATSDFRSKTKLIEREIEVHKVQILDPATGTGTFLAEVIKLIHSKFEGQQGIWSNYVETHLLPRLNGFELLMASYAMAHLKLDLLLTETGYKPTTDQRFRVFLTNSLEEHNQDTGTLFANWLSTEANEANRIKRDTPVMCVIGNPPYSVSSSNKSDWIEKLTEVYKNGVEGANKNSLSDDYVKFICLGQHLIDKNGEGILAYISNNSFIDGITHNKMRESLLNSFNKIYVLDLHGSFKKLEKTESGGKDENVFDIQQGVSISFFIKIKSNEKQVFHFDVSGLREEKYNFLMNNTLNSIEWKTIRPQMPNLFFKEFDYLSNKVFQTFFSIKDIFRISGTGIKFRKDNLLIKPHFNKKSVLQLLDDLEILKDEEIQRKYNIDDTEDWKIAEKKLLFKSSGNDIRKVQYRLFDFRYTFYPYDKINEIIVRGDSRRELMKHIQKENIALLTTRQQSSFDFQHAFITKDFVDMCTISAQSKESTNVFLLYLYDENNRQQTIGLNTERTPNLNKGIVNQISELLGLTFTNEKEPTENTFAPKDLLDYIYAVLHSPTYREKYKEFLKIDFPRVPYPKDKDIFWQLVKLGGELRQIHLLESPVVQNYITQYPEDGDNTVTKVKYQDGKVYINETQYFNNVPEIAWNFYIGGYQPAQKWLKDRKDRKLDFDDILHYQKIIVALSETDELMKEIDKIEI